VWDPLSSSQTRKLTSLLRQLASDYPSVSSEHRNTQSLFSSVLSRLRRATQDDVLIPLYTRAQVENSLSPHAVFYNQQFWSCVKLLGNITEWEGLVSPDALQELVLDGLLNKYLVLSLQTCPCSNLSVIKTGAIISRLPVTWLADGATVTRPLQGLVIYLTHLAQQLLQASIGHPDHLRLKTRSLVKEISEQLARLGATSESQSLCP
jgi:GC-rich sequence DNA-binding factor